LAALETFDESGDVSLQIGDAVGVEIPDDGCERPVVFADAVECLGEVLEDLDEFDGVGASRAMWSMVVSLGWGRLRPVRDRTGISHW
jgi:hypothetical protein